MSPPASASAPSSSPPKKSSRPGSRKPARGAAKGTRASGSTTAGPGSAGNASSAGRHGKFNANGEHVNGIWCASEAEAERYRQLLELETAGRIGNLKTQPRFDLTVNNVRIAGYRADFQYDVLDERGLPLNEIIEDVKGMQTPEFILKAKLFNALFPTPLTIIAVKGKARHPTRPKLDEAGKILRTAAGWMDLHWKGRIPV